MSVCQELSVNASGVRNVKHCAVYGSVKSILSKLYGMKYKLANANAASPSI